MQYFKEVNIKMHEDKLHYLINTEKKKASYFKPLKNKLTKECVIKYIKERYGDIEIDMGVIEDILHTYNKNGADKTKHIITQSYDLWKYAKEHYKK